MGHHVINIKFHISSDLPVEVQQLKQSAPFTLKKAQTSHIPFYYACEAIHAEAANARDASLATKRKKQAFKG